MSATVLTGKAIEWYRMKALLSALGLEMKGIPLSRKRKASHMVKDELGRAGVTNRGKPITYRSRIPLEDLYAMYEARIRTYEYDNGPEIKAGIQH